MRKVLSIAALFLLAACVTPEQQIEAVKTRAAYDLSCNPQKLQITWLQAGTYGAEGCRSKQVYTVQGSMVYKEGAAPNPVYIQSPTFYGGADIYRFR